MLMNDEAKDVLKKFQERMDRINADHQKAMRKIDRQGFWAKVVLIILAVALVVISLVQGFSSGE